MSANVVCTPIQRQQRQHGGLAALLDRTVDDGIPGQAPLGVEVEREPQHLTLMGVQREGLIQLVSVDVLIDPDGGIAGLDEPLPLLQQAHPPAPPWPQ
jgi:hypothetical protein